MQKVILIVYFRDIFVSEFIMLSSFLSIIYKYLLLSSIHPKSAFGSGKDNALTVLARRFVRHIIVCGE